MATRNAGRVKEWAEDTASQLIDDLDFDADAWEEVFDWVVKNVRPGQSYSTVLRDAKQWMRREAIGSRVAGRLLKGGEAELTGSPQVHGLDSPRKGGFTIIQEFLKDEREEKRRKRQKKSSRQAATEWWHDEAMKAISNMEEGLYADAAENVNTLMKAFSNDSTLVKIFKSLENLDKQQYKSEREAKGLMSLLDRWEMQQKRVSANNVRAFVRQAMYWTAPGRQYRLTQPEQNGEALTCPKCKGAMDEERFTRSERLYRCPHCGFKVPSGKVVRKKVEIEIEPDGGVDVDITGVDASDERGSRKAN